MALRTSSARDLRESLAAQGFAVVDHPAFDAARCARAMADARSFFDLPPVVKRGLAVEASPHFRGYSEMAGERDSREQIHFGSERAVVPEGPPHRCFVGPNLWPPDADWRSRLLALLRDLEIVSREVLSSLAESLSLPRDAFLKEDEDPYLVLKLICYHAAPTTGVRSGVAPHVDFSWITLVLQDGSRGLEMRRPDGTWVETPLEPGTLLVNTGEILELATSGRLRATPHRVVNRSGDRSRISIPFFLNPGLETTVRRILPEEGHVHRVLPAEPGSFVFGEAEFRRKALGRWCAACVGNVVGA